MRPAHFALWASFVIVAGAFAILLLSHCGGGEKAALRRIEALSCLDMANAALQDAGTCEEARAVLGKVVQSAPACLQLFGAQIRQESDAGIMVPCVE